MRVSEIAFLETELARSSRHLIAQLCAPLTLNLKLKTLPYVLGDFGFLFHGNNVVDHPKLETR